MAGSDREGTRKTHFAAVEMERPGKNLMPQSPGKRDAILSAATRKTEQKLVLACAAEEVIAAQKMLHPVGNLKENPIARQRAEARSVTDGIVDVESIMHSEVFMRCTRSVSPKQQRHHCRTI
jgi:hypothetical protein